MASSHHPGINRTLLLNIKRVTVQCSDTLEYGAKLTSFYWLAVRNRHGTNIKGFYTSIVLNSVLFKLEVIKTTTQQLCSDFNIYPLGTHILYISKETHQHFKTSDHQTGTMCGQGTDLDSKHVIYNIQAIGIALNEDMFSMYLISLIRKSLQSLVLICHIS